MMRIAGGTYREVCREGSWDQLFGSGLRAATAISDLSDDVVFETFVSPGYEKLLTSMARSFNVAAICHSCSDSILFVYDHALATPQVTRQGGDWSKRSHMLIEHDSVLRFGMVEGDAQVIAKRVVYDPQSPSDPAAFQANGSKADDVAVVCNRREATSLTGSTNPFDSARSLATSGAANVAVVKCGSDGAIVASRGREWRVPAYVTPHVWPLGSGDVFSAVFAWNWLDNGQEAVDAAMWASKAAAYYCCTQSLPIPSAGDLDLWVDSNCTGAVLPTPDAKLCSVYLAGPFFTMAERWLVNQTRDALSQQALRVFSPFHDVGLGGAKDVVPQDIAAIHDCDVMFAIVDHLDSGTLFEIGYARSIGKPVVGFCQNESEESLKMLSGTDCRIFSDFVTAVYHAKWILRS